MKDYNGNYLLCDYGSSMFINSDTRTDIEGTE